MEQVNLSLETTGLGFGFLITAFVVILVITVNKYRNRIKDLELEVIEERDKRMLAEHSLELKTMRLEELRVLKEKQQAQIARFERDRCDNTGKFVPRNQKK